MVISAIEGNQSLLLSEIEQRQQAAERGAAELLSKLQQEIGDLQRGHGELQQLEDSEDPLHLIQVRKP